MNLVDLVLIGLIALAAFSGFRRGALLQILTYAGLLLGLFVGALLAPVLAAMAEDSTTQTVIALVTFLSVAGLGHGLGWLVGARVWAASRGSRFQPIDAAGGSFVAVVALLLASWFVALNLASGPVPTISRQVRGSAIIRGVDALLPEPPAFVNGIRRFLEDVGFPEVFAGLPLAPAGPVDPPTQAQANRAFVAADESTVKVAGQACDRIQEGSGFVVAEHYIVTNAHVVAGMDDPEVIERPGDHQGAVTVLFDPDLDIAILRVETAPGPALELVAGEVDRGTRGAVVGYPGGGALAGVKAAVRRAMDARGRDIYGQDTVIREIYELQAEVVRGNSGGPFVLVDGTVAGVVFAASTADPNIGYAITSDGVRPLVDQALGRTSEVDTGPCTN